MNQYQLKQRYLDRKCSSKYPEQEYFAHLDEKSDNLPPRSQKDGTGHAIFKGRPPTRVEPNCDALDKLSESQAGRSIIQAES